MYINLSIIKNQPEYPATRGKDEWLYKKCFKMLRNRDGVSHEFDVMSHL